MELKDLISQTPDILNSADRIRGILGDIYMGDKAKVNVMMVAYQADIVSYVRSHQQFYRLMRASFVGQLVDQFALIEERAEWAVDQWIAALLSDEELSKYSSVKQKLVCNGYTYEGEVKNGVADGQGTQTEADGRIYTGEWANDQKQGKGIYTWPSGAKYEGLFQYDHRHGRGTQTEADGRIYIGEWVNDKKQGKGIYTWPSSAKYEGSFQDDARCGKGKHRYADGNTYEGDWMNNEPHGNGVFVWTNGDTYEGEFSEGLRHGHGTQHYADGWTYIGSWGKGKRRGNSTLVSSSGKKFSCKWVDDRCVDSNYLLKLRTQVTATKGGKEHQNRKYESIIANAIFVISVTAACIAIIYCFCGATISEDILMRLLLNRSSWKLPRLVSQIGRLSETIFARSAGLFSGFFSENIGGVFRDIEQLFMK